MKISVPKFKALRFAVTVEPMLFFYFWTCMVSMGAGTNMLLHKGCDPNATAAPDLRTSPHCLHEIGSQHGVSSTLAWKHSIEEIVSLVFVVFGGPWSDRHGNRRRPLMFLPVLGQMACDAVNLLLATVYWGVSPAISGVVQSVIVSATGSIQCFMVGTFAYLADVIDTADRTARIGYSTAVMSLALAFGSLATGYLNVWLGFARLFALNVGLNALALCLGLLLVRDTSRPYTAGSGSFCAETFDPNIVVDSFKTMFAKRDHRKRLILLLMFLASPLTSGPYLGEMNLLYLYLRNRFGLDEINFGIFRTYTSGIMVLGVLFTYGILNRILKMNDATIGLVATFFDIAAALGFLLVTQVQYLYFIPLFELFRGTALALTGAIASKCVETHEYGSMNSVRMAILNISKIAILPLYDIVYNKTLETFPGAIFIISLCLTVPLIGCFAITYYFTRNQVTRVNAVQENNSKDAPRDRNANTTTDNEKKSNSIVG